MGAYNTYEVSFVQKAVTKCVPDSPYLEQVLQEWIIQLKTIMPGTILFRLF